MPPVHSVPSWLPQLGWQVPPRSIECGGSQSVELGGGSSPSSATRKRSSAAPPAELATRSWCRPAASSNSQRFAVFGVVVEVVPEPDVAHADPPLKPGRLVDLDPESDSRSRRRADPPPDPEHAVDRHREFVDGQRVARRVVEDPRGRKQERRVRSVGVQVRR